MEEQQVVEVDVVAPAAPVRQLLEDALLLVVALVDQRD